MTRPALRRDWGGFPSLKRVIACRDMHDYLRRLDSLGRATHQWLIEP